MRKRFLNAVLFATAFATATGTLVSCKDYDDDIASLQEQINAKATAADLTAQLSTLTNDLNSVKSSLNSQVEALKAEIAEAQKGQDATSAELVKNLEAKLAELNKTVDAKLAAVDAASAKIDKLAAEIKKANEAELAKLAEQVDAMTAQVVGIVGHRLSSLSLIPTTHVNGIASIPVTTLYYTPQVYYKDAHNGENVAENEYAAHYEKDMKVLDHKAVTGAKRIYISGADTAYYHVSPTMGVRHDDILQPQYVAIKSSNTTRGIVNEAPIQGIDYTINNGVLSVLYKKSTKAAISNGDNVHDGTDVNKDGVNTENFTMVALQVPVAKANWTKDEVAKGDPVYVYSEYARLDETYARPYLYNTTADLKKATDNKFPDENYTLDAKVTAKTSKKYVHYHDSLCLYRSGNEELVDFTAPYNAEFDLASKVGVCINVDGTTGHEPLTPAKAAAYGLTFEFEVPSTPYHQGTLETDEQEFISETATNGVFTSKVYTVGDDGKSRTAIGREPIIRVRLMNGKNLVAQRYVKIRWIEEQQIKEQVINPFKFGTQFVSCKDMFAQLFTQDMNEAIYHQVKVMNVDGAESQSISKEVFHANYKKVAITSLKKDGVEILNKAVKLNGAPYIVTGAADANVNALATVTMNAKDKKTVDDVVITSTLAKDVKDGKVVKAAGEANDVIFGYVPDNTQSNTSYNLLWAMSPEAVGTVKKGGSTFDLTVQYISENPAYGVITQVLTQVINVPTQQFAYEGTHWTNGVGEGTFLVNPLVYEAAFDKADPKTGFPAHSSYDVDGLNDWSHIEADLMNGYINYNNASNVKNTTLAQFIQYIRGCADVKFVFDSSKFANYEALKDKDGNVVYKTDETGTQLWQVGKGKTLTPKTIITDDVKEYLNNNKDEKNKGRYTDAGILDYAAAENVEWFADNNGEVKEYKPETQLAASINNHLFATVESNMKDSEKNKDYFKWDVYNETLNGSSYVPFHQSFEANEEGDAAYAIIRLHETDAWNGTPAAINLVGKTVPVKLEITYNIYNVEAVQNFDVKFIEPLTFDNAATDEFTDAEVNGSFIEVGKNFTFTDWNHYTVAATDYKKGPKEDKTPELKSQQHALYDYYCIESVKFDVENAKTSLKKNGSTSIHTDAYDKGEMPAGHYLLQMKNYDGEPVNKPLAEEVDKNPTWLKYINNGGTPVDVDYVLYVNADVKYKWGVMSTKNKKNEDGTTGLTVKVKKAAGTADNQE